MKIVRWTAVLAVLLGVVFSASESKADVTESEAYEIGMEAYEYLYPLVIMDTTRRQAVNVEAGQTMGRGPMNTFVHVREFPPASFRDVVRPNFDTLYSIAWLDLRTEPVIVSAPDTAGRYYMLPMIDMWSDVFACPGKRTTGTAAIKFAIIPPNWKGALPEGVERIDAPTPMVWVIGRTQTNGAADYKAVHEVQNGYTVTPLSQYIAGKAPQKVTVKVDPSVDMKTPPMVQVDSMNASTFFQTAAELLKIHPPHITDQPIIARMKRIGIEPGMSFDLMKAAPEIRTALERVPSNGLAAIRAKIPTVARVVNGWQMNTDTMGVYGNYYLKRSIVAMIGLGANLPEDAVYPMNLADADGHPLNGKNRYVLHFEKDEIPPVSAFWSVTLYDEHGFPTENALNRNAIGDRDALKRNPDGSLDLLIQHESPGTDKESNWLSAPAGAFNLTMRLYAPGRTILTGEWNPPAIKKM
ncbi:MAG: DUF1254 domain-containing protein [Planctomyces sp.]|nr:DUF1254 domain-containing protein [Planctomyces sp.]